MATSILLNTVNVGTQVFYAGSEVDSAYDDVAAIRACGGRLWSSADAAVNTASALCKKKIAIGANDGIDSIMQASVASLFSSDSNEEGSGNFGTGLRLIRTVNPMGSASDSANLQAAIDSGKETKLGPGTFLITTKLVLRSNIIIEHHPNTVFSSSLADSGLAGGGFLSSVYYANAAAIGNDTTLATPTVAGDSSIICTAIPGGFNATTIKGQTVIFGKLIDNVVQQAKVLDITGSGPYTLILDEQVQYDLATSGSVVGVRTVPSGIILVGNGSIITGTGDRAIELGFARSCVVDGFRITRDSGSFTACAVSLDTGSVDGVIRNVHVDGGGTTNFMFGLESTVRCKLIDSSARFGGTAIGACGIYMASTRATEVRGVEVQKAKFGILVGADGTDDKGCRRSQIRSASLIQCSDDGIAIFGGSRDLEIDGANILKPGRYGIYVYVGSALSPERVKITNSTIDTATTNGLRVINAAKVEVDNVSIVSSGVGVYQANTAEIKGGRLTVSGGTLSVDVVAGTLDLANLETTDATTTAHVRVRGGAYVHLGHWVGTDSGVLANNTALLDFENANTIVKIDSGYLSVANASTIYGFICINGGAGCKAFVRNFNLGRSSGTAGAAIYAISTVTCFLDNTSTSGAWANGCYAVDQTCQFKVGPGCDFTSSTTPFGFSGTGTTAGRYGVIALAYSATIATNALLGEEFTIVATNGVAFTISNPTNGRIGQTIVYDILNSSGGALGAITWGGAFKLAGAFTAPVNTKRRTIQFYFDGTNWIETGRSAADI